jgi:uncharacterized damage-inducible protein DinB
MHTICAAALAVARESIALLDETLATLPNASLDWTPMSGVSSIAVLTVHCIVSAEWFATAATAAPRDRAEYRANERAEAFRTQGQTVEQLRARLADLAPRLEWILAEATDATLEAPLPWAEDSGRHRTGAEAVVAGIAHLREHVGQAQLMRDLWLSASREGR